MSRSCRSLLWMCGRPPNDDARTDSAGDAGRGPCSAARCCTGASGTFNWSNRLCSAAASIVAGCHWRLVRQCTSTPDAVSRREATAPRSRSAGGPLGRHVGIAAPATPRYAARTLASGACRSPFAGRSATRAAKPLQPGHARSRAEPPDSATAAQTACPASSSGMPPALQPPGRIAGSEGRERGRRQGWPDQAGHPGPGSSRPASPAAERQR